MHVDESNSVENAHSGANLVRNDNIGQDDNELISETPLIESNILLMSDKLIVQQKVSKNMRDLMYFLRSSDFITEKGDQKTNIINVANHQTFCIPESYIEEFFTLLEDCRKEKLQLHFLEKQVTDTLTHSGIMLDFDRYQRTKESQIRTEHFLRLAREIAKILIEIINFESLSKNGRFQFNVFIIKKPAIVSVQNYIPEGSTKQQHMYKDGFHILIPEIQIVKGAKIYLVNELIKRGVIGRIFNDIENIENPSKMLDHGSTRNPVHFVGNSKVGAPAYPLTHAFQITIEDTDVMTLPAAIEDINAGFMPGKNGTHPINISYELSLSFYLETIDGHPTWLHKRNYDCKSHIGDKIQSMMEHTRGGILPVDEFAENEGEIDMLTATDARLRLVRDLLDMLDQSHTEEYEKWFKTICAIAHTGRSDNYKKIAMWFSRRRPTKWNQAEFDRVWNEATNARFNRNPVTLRSIRYWAKAASPQRYEQKNSENYTTLLRNRVCDNEARVEHAMVAEIIYAMLGDKFATDCDPNERNQRSYNWYEFVLPGQTMKRGEVFKWRREINPDNLHMFISDQLPKVYKEVQQMIRDRKEAAENENAAKYYDMVEKTLGKYRSGLSNDSFQNSTIRQAQYRFRVRGFIEELDSYPDIIGVGNGVLKLGHESSLIKGFHEYKISKFTDVDYIPFDPENACVKVLLGAFRDIFPEQDVFNYIMMYFATWLDGRESDCIMLFLVGGGQNGKSFAVKMAQSALGLQYVKPLKMSLITAPMERAESANSAHMDLKGLHGGYLDESGERPQITIERFKSIVNPGLQTGRQLHGRQEQFKITANLIALSNYDFVFNTTDHGTWRRVRYYKNKIKFCKNPKAENKYEKKEDRRFIYEYPNDMNYRQAMLSILVHYYEQLMIEYNGDITKVPCPTIDYETDQFRNNMDTINKYINLFVVLSPRGTTVSLNTVAHKYAEWYRKQFGDKGAPKPDHAEQLFENSKLMPYLERKSNGSFNLNGCRIKNSVEEELEKDEKELSAKSIDNEFAEIGQNLGENMVLNLGENLEKLPENNSDEQFLHQVGNNVPEKNTYATVASNNNDTELAEELEALLS